MKAAGRRSDGVMRLLARAAIHVFFRETEVEHPEHMPAHGPVLVVANHTNGLVDGLLLIALLRRYPRFLGKATLFKILPLKPLLRLAGVVPVHRAKDGDTAGNEATFRSCRLLLAGGGVVAIFPEGISHDEVSLQPLKTGAARIALGAAFEEGADGIAVVPVGLSYDDKARFRSRALVTVGEPIPVSPMAGAYADDPREAVRSLTAEIDVALRTAGPDYASPAQAEQLAGIAEIVALPSGGELPQRAALGGREDVARRLARVDDAALGPLVDAHATYRRDLALLGVGDAHVAAGVTPARLRLALFWAVVKAVATAPLALAGYVIHVVPYELMRRVGRLPENEGVKSTIKVLGCALIFLVIWVVLGVLVGARSGWVAGLAAFAAGPFAGYTTVRFVERLYRTTGLVKGYGVLRGRRAARASVEANRERVRTLADELLA